MKLRSEVVQEQPMFFKLGVLPVKAFRLQYLRTTSRIRPLVLEGKVIDLARRVTNLPERIVESLKEL